MAKKGLLDELKDQFPEKEEAKKEDTKQPEEPKEPETKQGEDEEKTKPEKSEEPQKETESEKPEEGSESEESKQPEETKKEESEEDELLSKLTLLIAGEKSEGKTVAAYTAVRGTKYVLGFDNQSLTAYHSGTLSEQDRNEIVKIDMLNRFFRPSDRSDNEAGKAASSCVEQTFKTLKTLEKKIRRGDMQIDWIIIDNFGRFVRWAEWDARGKRGIPVFQKGGKPGQDFFGVWDERNEIIYALYNEALGLANKGVIYTTYSKTLDDGKETPRWIDAVKYETMVHVMMRSEFDPDDGKKYYATILGTKGHLENVYPDGLQADVTQVGLKKGLEIAKRGK